MSKRDSRGQSRSTLYRKRKRYEQHSLAGTTCSCPECLRAARNNLYHRAEDDLSNDDTSSNTSASTADESDGGECANMAMDERMELQPSAEEEPELGVEVQASNRSSVGSDQDRNINDCDNHEREVCFDGSVIMSEESCDEDDGEGHPGSSNSSDSSSSSSSDGSDPNEDPPPQDDPSSSDSDSSSSSEENFNLNADCLNEELRIVRPSTARDALALYLAVSVTYGLSYEALIAVLQAQNTLLGGGLMPKDRRKLWKVLQRTQSGITTVHYCSFCLSKVDNPDAPYPIRCGCGRNLEIKDVKYFMHVSLQRQIKHLLQSPAVRHLRYREDRVKRRADALEDIYDGAAYKRLQENGVISETDFSYTFNSDGFRVSKKGDLEAWPIYVRLNEISPQLRQKYTFLAGLWIDSVKPNFNIFLEPFITEANTLSSVGIDWERDGVLLNSKFIPTCLCVDSKARAPLLNMKDVTGFFGCTFCTHPGVWFGQFKVKFPIAPNPPAFDFQLPVLRTWQGMLDNIHEAGNLQNVDDDIQGHKGATQLMNLDHFNLFVNQVTDDLHPIYEGAVKAHLNMFLKRDRPYSLSAENIRIANQRLHSAKTPTHIARKPRREINKGKWKGSEYRNWLIHYSIPCLNGLLPRRYLNHWALLASAAFLLHQTVITEEDLNDAQQSIQLYLELYQFYFGPENMRYNLHVLSHLVECVRNWGPLWTQSTFHFESWNFKLLRYVKSVNTAKDQIVTRFLLHLLAERTSLDDEISPHVRQHIKKVMGEKIHVNVTAIQDVYYLGRAMVREPTNEEQGALDAFGITCARLQSFDRVLLNSKEFRCIQYNPNSKSSNSWLYLSDGRFCQVQHIVLIDDVLGDVHCGAFVRICHVTHRAINARFMACVNNPDVLEYVQLHQIQSLCVKVDAGGNIFLSPIPNQHEID